MGKTATWTQGKRLTAAQRDEAGETMRDNEVCRFVILFADGSTEIVWERDRDECLQVAQDLSRWAHYRSEVVRIRYCDEAILELDDWFKKEDAQ